MSLPRPRPTSYYRLSSNLMERAADWIIDKIERHAAVLGVVAVFAIYLFAGTLDGREQLRAENERLQEQMAALADYTKNRHATVTISGDRATVSNLAGQIAARIEQ